MRGENRYGPYERHGNACVICLTCVLELRSVDALKGMTCCLNGISQAVTRLSVPASMGIYLDLRRFC